MAVFYYSTNGDRWNECSAGSATARGDADEATVEEEPINIVEGKQDARTAGDNKNMNKNKGKNNKEKKRGQDNCLKYCRDKCCKDNGGSRLCNSDSELECRADCFMEINCNWKEAKKLLERRREDSSSGSRRDRNKKRWKKKDKRKKKKSKKGGRSTHRRRLQVSRNMRACS